MYSIAARKSYAELLKTATETLAPMFDIKVDELEAPAEEENAR